MTCKTSSHKENLKV